MYVKGTVKLLAIPVAPVPTNAMDAVALNVNVLPPTALSTTSAGPFFEFVFVSTTATPIADERAHMVRAVDEEPPIFGVTTHVHDVADVPATIYVGQLHTA